MGNGIRIAIVDDHPLVACGLRKAAEATGFDVQGAVTSSSQFMQLLAESTLRCRHQRLLDAFR